MSSRIVLNLRTLRQGPFDGESVSTDIAFELGALSAARRSAYPGATHHGAGRTHFSTRDPNIQSRSAPSSAWPSSDSKGDTADAGRLHTTSIGVTIQVDVLREVEVDEFDEESADDSRWKRGDKKAVRI